MKRMKYLLFAILFFASCKKFVDVPPPADQVVQEVVFADEASAEAALNGMYSAMRTHMALLNGALPVYCGLSSDELFNTTSSGLYNPFYENAIPASEFSTNYNRLWAKGYNYIYYANSLLEGVAQSGALPLAVKKKIRGEALFSRALVYYYLCNLYGNVPLIVTTDYRVNSTLAQSPLEDVLRYIREDLAAAAGLLQADYPTAGKVRANRYAALALLARVELQLGNEQTAIDAANSVINSGSYSLAAAPADAFLQNGEESIFQLLPGSGGFNTGDGNAFVPSPSPIGRPNFQLTPALLNSFETGDRRRTDWVGVKTVSGTTYYYPYKYKVRSGSTITEHVVALRLAELYLIRAEARLQSGMVADAVDDLNMIRQRAGLPLLGTGISADSCAVALWQERRIELMAEWGHRWFDLKRSGRIDEVLSQSKPSWSSAAALFPIPQRELDRNPNLVQNPGY